MKIPASLVSTLALALLSGCQPAPSPDPTPAPSMQICTKIGCSDGLTVVVENAPAAPYTVDVTLPDGSSRTTRCDSEPAICDAGLFFEGVTAEEVTVRITGGAGTSSQVFRPEYVESQPNGPNCPPTCRQARVQVRYSP